MTLLRRERPLGRLRVRSTHRSALGPLAEAARRASATTHDYKRNGTTTTPFDLKAAINRFLRESNDNPKPFTWTADPGKIIADVRRGHQMLDSIHQEADRVGVFGMDRQQKIDHIANQHSGVSKVSNVRVNTIRINPDYDLELCDGVRSDTGKLEIIKFAPKSGDGPYFIGRWDQKTERLDIDMYGASQTATKEFKKGKAGYSGHHPNRRADPNTRTFEFRIDTPPVGFVFKGSVSFANTFQIMAKFVATSKLNIGIQAHRGGTTLKGEGHFSV